MAANESSDLSARQPREKTARHRRKKRRGLPAHIVFYLLIALAVVGVLVTVTLGGTFIIMALLVSFVLSWALYVNDRRGFIRSDHMRRAHEPRRHFNSFEVLLVLLMIFANIVLAVYELVTSDFGI